MKNLSFLPQLACWLLVIGGLNWGLVGLFKFNLVTAIFGSVSWLESLVYILVGLSAVYSLFSMKKCCLTKDCGCK
jgi:hypothetical protein